MLIDHIGIVVRSLEDGIRQWEDIFGYTKNSAIVLNTRQKVRVVFLDKRDSITIKLIEPADPRSPIASFARRGGGLHHLCFRCEDLETQTAILNKKGLSVIVPPEPGEAFEGHNIAFLLAHNGLNIELIDTQAKLGWKPL